MQPQIPTNLNEQLRAGDPQAAEAVFVRYANQLVRIAEQHLSKKLASRLGGDDVVQSVFRTFFRRVEAGEFQIDSSGDLWRLLVRITILKARAKARHHMAAKRAAEAEVVADSDDLVASVSGREPNPAEAAELVDLMDALLAGLPEEYARVLESRLSGDSVAETASRLGMSRQGVYRMLAYVQDRLLKLDPTARPAASDADPESAV
jgi:RNA polymerase sigma-70 factor (ECF subfamily)